MLSKREALVLTSSCYASFNNGSKLQGSFSCGIVVMPHDYFVGSKPLVKSTAWIFAA